MTQSQLTAHEKALLDIMQADFPLTPRPYAEIGKKLGMDEDETLELVRGLKKRGIIRRIGPNFQSSKLGFRSTLCAARVPEEKLQEFINAVNKYPGVTHNYLRAHAYNVWFTLIGPSWDAVCATLDEIKAATGISILNLPAERLYKIRVKFPMGDGGEVRQAEVNI